MPGEDLKQMAATIVQQVIQDEDLEQLRQIASGIIGETCWQARLSYGGELRLESGTKIIVALEHSSVVLEEGEWGLGTRATPWKLESSTGEIIALLELEPEIIEQKVHIIEGTTINAFDQKSGCKPRRSTATFGL